MNHPFYKFLILAQILLLGVMIVNPGCSNQPGGDSIEALEAKFKEVTSGSGINHDEVRQVMTDLASAYEKFSKDKPADPEAPNYLYKAAELYETNMMNIGKAMELFDKIIVDYPENERAADALFKKGYVLHNTLKDLPKAKATYIEFLAKYPEHDLASSAKFEIENLGVPAKDLLERIQQSEDSTDVSSNEPQ